LVAWAARVPSIGSASLLEIAADVQLTVAFWRLGYCGPEHAYMALSDAAQED